jgi:predicted murein hydrolase (TIGR00659 family)
MLRLGWSVASVAVTLFAYWASRRVNTRFPSPLTNPVFLAAAGVMFVLAIPGLDYDSYRRGAEPLVALLGPATAALAIPLYKHRQIVVVYFWPAIMGLACGAMATLFAAVILAVSTGMPSIVVRSIGVKSVTAPIAVELAPLIGGDPALTVVLVVGTAILGAMLGPWLLDHAGVRDPAARGLAFGTIATGIGTAQAAMEGEIQGAVAGVAMGIAAIAMAMVAPVLIPRLVQLLM